MRVRKNETSEQRLKRQFIILAKNRKSELNRRVMREFLDTTKLGEPTYEDFKEWVYKQKYGNGPTTDNGEGK